MSKNKGSEPQQVSDKETEIILSIAEDILDGRIKAVDGGPLEGDFCEFGCYRGDTSLLLEKLLENHYRKLTNDSLRRSLWIYDSFEGLPPKSPEDSSVAGDSFQAGKLLVTKREVVERFKKASLRVPRIRKGFFDQLDDSIGSRDLPEKIAFAFLDGDLYSSIKTSFTLIASRMIPGGIIIVHDYNNPQLPGVAKAVDEWLTSMRTAQKISPTLSVRETLAIIKL